MSLSTDAVPRGSSGRWSHATPGSAGPASDHASARPVPFARTSDTRPVGPPLSIGGQLSRWLRTVRHIPASQLAARAHFMALRRLYAAAPAWPIARARRRASTVFPKHPIPALPVELLAPEGLDSVEERAAAAAMGRFSYLGRAADFSAGVRWRDPEFSPLWRFNLHYLHEVLDLALTGRTGDARALFTSWHDAFATRWDAVAWHPYPVSLRLANLCFAAGHLGTFAALAPHAADAAAVHAAFLLGHLEHDLRGNHLLENAFALLAAARYLTGPMAARCERVARALFAVEIPEQIHRDGSHFELSPMYHALALHRLLQAVALIGEEDSLARGLLLPAIARMAAFLRQITCPNGELPPIGDAANGIAPPPLHLLDLARRVVPVSPATGRGTFPDAGLHVLRGRRLWTIFDAGAVCADYLPGHGQADSLTIEVWSDGACLVGDPGVHEYTGPERDWGRSSRAHSTLTIDDADTSEVYGSFRIGGRARITMVAAATNGVTATLEPFGTRAHLIRSVRLHADAEEKLVIADSAIVPQGRTVRSRLHLHPEVTVLPGPGADPRTLVASTPNGRVRIEARHPIQLEAGRVSRHYGVIEPTIILVQTLAPESTCGSVLAASFVLTPLGDEG